MSEILRFPKRPAAEVVRIVEGLGLEVDAELQRYVTERVAALLAGYPRERGSAIFHELILAQVSITRHELAELRRLEAAHKALKAENTALMEQLKSLEQERAARRDSAKKRLGLALCAGREATNHKEQ